MKKILLIIGGVILIAIVVFGVQAFSVLKSTKDFVESKEPELVQYTTMTEEEQNAYIEKNMDEFLKVITLNQTDADGKPYTWEKLKQNPELRAMGISCGRALCAGMVESSEKIPDNVKQKFEKESLELQSRMEEYKEMLKKFSEKKSS